MKVHLRSRERKSGTAYYLDYYINNKRIREQLEIPNSLPPKDRLSLAQQFQTKKQFEFNNKVGFVNDKITLLELITQYLAQYKKKDYRKIKNGCDRFLEVAAQEKLISEILPLDCKDFKDFISNKYTTDTAQSYFKAVKKVFTYAVDRKYISVNPFEHIKSIRSRKDFTKEIPTQDDIKKLENAKCSNPEIKRAYLFCCNTGLGNTDCRKLKYSQIVDGHITGERGKGRTNRIPLNNAALELIGTGTGQVFNIPSDSYIARSMKDWCATAEVTKHLTFYSARHYFASRLVQIDVDLETVRDLMGHSSFKYLRRYVHLNDKRRKQAVDKLNDI